MDQREAIIVVFGSSRARPGEPLYDLALDLGRRIARAGWTLCNGGYGGTMEAAARGAKEFGGRTIGVTCDAFGSAGANRFIDREIRTPDLFARLRTLIDMGTGFVVLPGGTGTLVELATVWELLCKDFVQGRPLVAVGDFWRPLVEPIARHDPDAAAALAFADTAAEAVSYLSARLGGKP